MQNRISTEVQLEVVREICDFVNYVNTFYNENDGVYKIVGLKTFHITEAVYIYFLHNQHKWGGGDSTDREAVRDIILEKNPSLTTYWS